MRAGPTQGRHGRCAARPRRHVYSPNVDDGREHRLHKHRAQSLAIVHAILQTQDSGIGAKVRPQRARGCLGIGRLDAEEHYVGVTRGLRVGGRGNPDRLASICPFDNEPIARDRIRLAGRPISVTGAPARASMPP